MGVDCKVDWLAVTAPRGWVGVWNTAPGELLNCAFKEGKGTLNYSESRTYANGISMMKNDHREDMPPHTIFSGSTLSEIEKKYNISGFDLTHWFVTRGFTFSRIDLAIDCFDEKIDVSEFHELFHCGKCNTRSQTCKIISEKSPETVCIGSLKTRRNLLRIYDKGIEQKLDGFDWKRFELERRRERATQTAIELRQGGYTYETVSGIIRGHSDFPESEQWERVMTGDRIKTRPIPDKESQTVAWLLNSVAPAMARQMTVDEDILERFLSRVALERNSIDKPIFED